MKIKDLKTYFLVWCSILSQGGVRGMKLDPQNTLLPQFSTRTIHPAPAHLQDGSAHVLYGGVVL